LNCQKTLGRTIDCRGIALHSGKEVRMRLHPAKQDAGISFVRTDMDGAKLRLHRARVIRADHATTLAGKGFTVSTSAAPFIYLIREAGSRRLRAFRRYLVLEDSVEVRDGDREISIHPADRLRVSYTIDFPGTVVGRQSFSRTLYQKVFVDGGGAGPHLLLPPGRPGAPAAGPGPGGLPRERRGGGRGRPHEPAPFPGRVRPAQDPRSGR
jgi:UDP-3-O-[3-hydroxymyristoyl] N-acetylglucosamine deacetylase